MHACWPGLSTSNLKALPVMSALAFITALSRHVERSRDISPAAVYLVLADNPGQGSKAVMKDEPTVHGDDSR
jgi:hypothetical protein